MINKEISEKDNSSELFKKEEVILKFWEDNKIFEKSLSKDNPKGEYSFYDGPPFATGLPHYGHIVASLLKDVFPRYKTMCGYKVSRKWGWDCHGLPVEALVEKDLGLKDKSDIENKIGIDKFNEACRNSVMKYADEWEKFIPMIGRWVDMKNDYKTMDLEYMESVWWIFKQLWEKGLIYEGYKSMHICPRCETTLANFEVTQGYKDIEDISVTAKFELVDDPNTYVLAWTTTPWTLPGNVALAVGNDIEYVKIQSNEEKYILAKSRLEDVFKGVDYEFIENVDIKKLVGKKYKPLFDFSNEDLKNKENLYTIQSADFVTTEDGTGIVHIAPAFGEDDMNLGNEKKLSFIQHVDPSGRFTSIMGEFAGIEVKSKDSHQNTDIEILKYLSKKGLIFSKEKYKHSYPHCWRCDSPLINYATGSWFVKVTDIKDNLIKNNREINWVPDHFKEGRMGKWLEGARDWSISRQRYWGSVLPIWRCSCGETKVIGSIKELEDLSGKKVNDLHKHIVDNIKFKCSKCDEEMTRIPDVFDCWFESGSMPYASVHYPFENEKWFEDNFPADFIAEGQDQTRGWFYTLLVLSTALFDKPAFKNVVVNGIVLAENGQKMSKRLKNYPDPVDLIKKYSADVIRYYLLSSPVVRAGDLCFSEKDVATIYSRYFLTLLNVLSFYKMYEKNDDSEYEESNNLLDKWLIAKLKKLTIEITENMEKYELKKSLDSISEFILELSTWYLRRSRDRFKDGDKFVGKTLHHVLFELSKILAPFIPFTAEYLSKELDKNLESIHLLEWPSNIKVTKEETLLLEQMEEVRNIVEKAHNQRDLNSVKLRQPLLSAKYGFGKSALLKELEDIIREEINVESVVFDSNISEVELDFNLTEELKEKGIVREIVRQINSLRKNAKLTIKDKIKVYIKSDEYITNIVKNNLVELKNSVLCNEFFFDEIPEEFLISEDVKINEFHSIITLTKISTE